ncbi:iron-sulfur cluster co-chaperone HscB C-terminal domain-containing protein [Chitinophaga lutea]|nr:iron-sulfur cluster co-chaperone HscB C-terminal domain-containing protein [Chitinophaga lutea]
MNYFEMFNIPVSLEVHEGLLQQRYLGMPGTDENREAYLTLVDPCRLLPYVLELKGVLRPGEKMQLPHMFMMEMMPLGEQLFALEAAPEGEVLKFRRQMEKLLARMWAEVEPIGELTPEKLQELKELHFKQKYLLRMLERISTFASRDQVL